MMPYLSVDFSSRHSHEVLKGWNFGTPIEHLLSPVYTRAKFFKNVFLFFYLHNVYFVYIFSVSTVNKKFMQQPYIYNDPLYRLVFMYFACDDWKQQEFNCSMGGKPLAQIYITKRLDVHRQNVLCFWIPRNLRFFFILQLLVTMWSDQDKTHKREMQNVI
jgi:hypothetical protein